MNAEEKIGIIMKMVKEGRWDKLNKLFEGLSKLPLKSTTKVSKPEIKDRYEERIKIDGDIDEMNLEGNESKLIDLGTEVGTIYSLSPQISESEYSGWLENFGYRKVKRTSKYHEVFLFKKRGWPDINLDIISNPFEVLINHFEAVVLLPLISDTELLDAQKRLIELIDFTKKFKTIMSVHDE